MKLDTFWKQPAKGFNEESRGRTEEEICIREEQVGFRFPKTYRDLMKLQNGGYIRRSAFYYNGECRELIYNGGTIDRITAEPLGYQTMRDVLTEWKDEDEMNSLSPTEYNYLDRLLLISHMDGHEWMCFDFGWTEQNIRTEPEICFFNDEFKEYLRLANFDEFVNGLVYYGYESCQYFFGLRTSDSIEQIAEQISKKLSFDIKEKKDNGNGWFNFSKWYSGAKQVDENLIFRVSVSPNKSLSDTYLFQEHPDLNYIIGVTPIQNKYEDIANDSDRYLTVMKGYFDLLDRNKEILELLIPENIESV